MLRVLLKQKCYLMFFVIFLFTFCRGTEGFICATNDLEYNKKMIDCAKEGKLADYSTYRCFEIFSPEPCNYRKKDSSRWFVYDPICKRAKCVEKINCTKNPSSKCPSCNIDGEVRKYNITGEVICGCDWSLGLFKYNNKCYQQYSTGLCSGEGRKVMVPDGTNGYTCRDSTCPEGQQKWIDGACYEIRETYCSSGIYSYSLPVNKSEQFQQSQPLKIDEGLINPFLQCWQPQSSFDIGNRATIDNCVTNHNNECKNFSDSPPEKLSIDEQDFSSILEELKKWRNISFRTRR